MDTERKKSNTNGMGTDGRSIYVTDEVVDLLGRFGKRGEQTIKDIITSDVFGDQTFSDVCVTVMIETDVHDGEIRTLYRPVSQTGRKRVEIAEKLYAKVDTKLPKRKDAYVEDVILPGIKQWLRRGDHREEILDIGILYNIKSGRTLKKLKPYIVHFEFRGSDYHICVDWKDSDLMLYINQVRAGEAGASARRCTREGIENGRIEPSTDCELEMG